MKVAELEGEKLDLWAGNALDLPVRVKETDIGVSYCIDLRRRENYGFAKFQPSKNWELAGPMIEQRCISIEAHAAHIWTARAHRAANLMRPAQDLKQTGPTPLIAAMRVLVAWRFGDEVPDSH